MSRNIENTDNEDEKAEAEDALESRLRRNINLAALGITALGGVLRYSYIFSNIDIPYFFQDEENLRQFALTESWKLPLLYIGSQGIISKALSMTRNNSVKELSQIGTYMLKKSLGKTTKEDEERLKEIISLDRKLGEDSLDESEDGELSAKLKNKLFYQRKKAYSKLPSTGIFNSLYDVLGGLGYLAQAEFHDLFEKDPKEKESKIYASLMMNHCDLGKAIFSPILWKKLHRLNPDKAEYLALEAVFDSTRHRKNPEKASPSWRKFLEHLEKDGLEKQFSKKENSRNEVFEMSIEGVKFFIKRNQDDKVIEREYSNLKNLQGLEHVVVPAHKFRKDDYSYLVTLSGGEKNLYEHVKDVSLENRVKLLEDATRNLEEIYETAGNTEKSLLDEDSEYFTKKADSVSQRLKLPDEMRVQIREGFKEINDRLCRIASDERLSGLLMQYYKDMNPKNIITDTLYDKINLNEADFESDAKMPCLTDYISLWEFERNFIPYEIVNDKIRDSIGRMNEKKCITLPEEERGLFEEEVEELTDYARVQRHWDMIGYRHRDLENSGEENNIAYKFYHKKMLDEALGRLSAKEPGLRQLKKAMDEINEYALDILA